MTSTKQQLDSWSFAQIGGGEVNKDGEWLNASQFPTSVHAELLKLKKIPDPFVGLNEWEVQWIGEADWAFQTTFEVPSDTLGSPNVDLVFEGLDTYASVELNGKNIIEANNMFVEYRTPVKSLLVQGQNKLHITFHSAWLKGKQLEQKNGKLNLWNGDSSRLHVRKAQYHYGWDWGPILMTVGPWKPIYIHSYTTRITDLRITQSITPSFTDHKIDLRTVVSISPFLSTGPNDHRTPVLAQITLSNPNPGTQKPLSNTDIASHTFQIGVDGKTTISISFDTSKVDLWYPVGYGSQPLYDLTIALTSEDGKEFYDKTTKRIGFRNVRVVQEPLIDEEGRSFYFEVNGIRIFCGGSNWIPADSFITNITPKRYRDWLQLMVDGNQNMVRVWGGGIYESDTFYDLCDELGLLVWQDFAFGCGQYPAYDELLERLQPEVEQTVTRLRHHPSLVIFAGNNEDYALAESMSLDLDYSDETGDYRKTNFPARHIYERVLPEAVARLSDVHYHRSSPYSGFGKPSSDKLYGDIHQWNVWHGSQEPWHNWDILAGRFVSEFGMEGYPDRRTVDFWTGDDKSERFVQSRTTVNHNKADGFERRLELYLVENFKHSFDMDSYIYYTQIMQAETLASAYRLWRRNWKGKGREYTAGALVWQINDCWPVTSWAIVDYFLRPKPAYFAIARELKKYTVGMTRKDVKTTPKDKPDSAACFEIDTKVEIWGTNSNLKDKPVNLIVEAFDLHDTNFTFKETHEHVLLANQSTELWQGRVPGQEVRTKLSQVPRAIIVGARVVDKETGEVLGRYANWPEPFKYIRFPSLEEVGLKISTAPSSTHTDATEVRLSSRLPIKGIVLDAEGEADVKWSDQAIDLIPGDEQVVLAWGLNGREVKARYLGDGSA